MIETLSNHFFIFFYFLFFGLGLEFLSVTNGTIAVDWRPNLPKKKEIASRVLDPKILQSISQIFRFQDSHFQR